MMCVFHRAVLWILHITSVSTTLVSGTLEINPHKKRKDFCSTGFCVCKNICGTEILPSGFLFPLSEKLIPADFLPVFLFPMPGFPTDPVTKKAARNFAVQISLRHPIFCFIQTPDLFSVSSAGAVNSGGLPPAPLLSWKYYPRFFSEYRK